MTASTMEDLSSAADRCIAASSSPSATREYLRLVREAKVRQSERVASYGSRALREHRSSFPQEELWIVMEQVAEAALDVKALDLASTIIEEIHHKFPNAQRTLRLTAMYFEAKGKMKEAEDQVTKMLEDHPDSHYAFKRQVAMEQSKGNVMRAIELLRQYLDTFMTDKDGWAELGDLYLQVQAYQQAAHCYEEVLLHSPQNIAIYVRYADVLYTMGGVHLKTARQYYAAALKLSNGEDLRALYGVCCTAATLSGQKAKPQKEDEELSRTAGELLQKLYAENRPNQLPLVDDLLKVQGVGRDI